jgi:hypothetical protein
MKTLSLNEIAERACFAMEDYNLRNKMRFLKLGRMLFVEDLNLGAVRQATRQFMRINKYTNSIDLPANTIQLSAISYVDENGHEWPIYRSSNIKHGIVDISATKSCECENGGQLCAMIKNYESKLEVVEDKNPDGTTVTFHCYSIIAVDDTGTLYETKQYPIRKYQNNVWVATELKTEKREICKLEINENKCVIDSEKNFETINKCFACSGGQNDNGLPPNVTRTNCLPILGSFSINAGVFYASPKNKFWNVYNISENGKRIIFPKEFPFEKVLVRMYLDEGINEIKVPVIAASCMVTGILAAHYEHKQDIQSQRMYQLYARRYTDQKTALMQMLNISDHANMQMTLTPPARW